MRLEIIRPLFPTLTINHFCVIELILKNFNIATHFFMKSSTMPCANSIVNYNPTPPPIFSLENSLHFIIACLPKLQISSHQRAIPHAATMCTVVALKGTLLNQCSKISIFYLLLLFNIIYSVHTCCDNKPGRKIINSRM